MKTLTIKAITSIAPGLVMMAVLAFIGGRAQAADTWAGNTSAKWNASNWTGSHNPPVSGDSLIFGAAGSSGTALNDDLTTSGFNIAGITYNSGAAAFTVTNNTFVLTGPVANNSTSLETINDPFSITNSETFTTTSGGGDITLGGIISGVGGSITKAGSGTLTLSGVNTYTGATTVSGGTLVFSEINGYTYVGGTLSINGTSTLKLTGHTSGAQLHFSTKTFSFDSTGGGTLNSDSSGGGSPNFVASTCTYQTLGGAQDTIGNMGANGINLNGNYSTFDVASGTSGSSDLLITSAIENAGGITKTGAGTLALTGANTYSGATTISAGTLTISGAGTLGSGMYAGAITNNGAFVYASSADQTNSGVISGTGTVTNAGSGTLTLSGVNTYTGATTVSGGTLVFSETNGYVYTGGTLSINGSSTLKLTGTTSGAQLHFSGKTFSFDSTGGGTLSSDASGGGSPNFVASSCTYQTLGGAQDTIGSMGANGINLNGNYSTFNVASGTSGSSDLLITSAIENSGGIIKTGAGTMALTGINTYSGATTISNGILQGVVGGSCSNSAVTVSATAGNSVLDISVISTNEQWTCSSLTVNNGNSGSGLQFDFGSLTPSTNIAPLNVIGGVTFSTPPVITVNGTNVLTSSGYGYPLMTWGSGYSAPDLTGVTINLNRAQYVGSLAVVSNTLYLHSIEIPSAIAGQGYGLVWHDEFDSLASIDLSNSKVSGFKWYIQPPFAKTNVPASDFIVPQPSVVRILGSNTNDSNESGEQLVSAVSTNVGFTIANTNGFYIEARIMFSSDQVINSNAWPAFWTRSSEAAFGIVSPWPGTTNGWQNQAEIDVMEYDQTSLASYGGTIHSWFGTDAGTNRFTDCHSLNNSVPYPGGLIPTNVWHTYGCLMVPSWNTSSNNGYCRMYIDNVLGTNETKTWVNSTNLWTNNPNAMPYLTNTEPRAFSAAELWHRMIAVGTAKTGNPMDVDWVRVWQIQTNFDQFMLKKLSSNLIGLPSMPTNITATISRARLTVSWPNSYTGWQLQVQTSSINTGLGTNWQTISGSDATNAMTFGINPTNTAVFYR